MQLFLTGGTGYIGQPLTKALLARGWDVVALVRKPNSLQAQALTKLGARCVSGDVTDRESMRAAMTGADIVIHNAGWYEFGVSQKVHKLMYAINVTGTENVLNLAQELDVKRVVYVSTSLYYGNTGAEVRDESYQRQAPYASYYEQTKSEAHEVAQGYAARGMPLIIVCPAAVMGPNDHSVWGYFLRLYLNGMMPPFAWSPATQNSGVYVDDVAEGIALATEKGRTGESYLLAGDPIRAGDIIKIWMTQPGGLRVRFFAPTVLVTLMFASMEPLQRLLGLPAFLSRETARGGDMPHVFSSAKAQRELGWTYRPSRQMWLEIIEKERKLMASRQGRDPVSRLKPLEHVVTTDI